MRIGVRVIIVIKQYLEKISGQVKVKKEKESFKENKK